MEPEYLAQTADFADRTPDERRQWFQMRAGDAHRKGMTWLRFTVDHADNPTMALVEGWIVQPEDDGEPRWQMTTVGEG